MIVSPDQDAERDAIENMSLAGFGFDTDTKAKEAVESVCPGVVSCADVLAMVARDVVVAAEGPVFNVELGRRDDLISKASHVFGQIPQPRFNLRKLNTIFAKHNLSHVDMIALSGAHTLGFAHCESFSDRLYSFSLTSKVDPSMDPTYAQQLMASCPENGNPGEVVTMDPQTLDVFDNVYYQNLVAGRGLFILTHVMQVGGPVFSVELRRRDDLISKASRVFEKIPQPPIQPA